MALDFFLYVCISKMEDKKVKENILLVDVRALDRTAGHLRRFMSRQLSRELPVADLADWIVCCAMDAGWHQPERQCGMKRVVFVRPCGQTQLQHFHPGLLTQEVDGKAFSDPLLGEVCMSVVVEESSFQGKTLYVQCVETLLADDAGHRLTLVADTERYGDELEHAVGAGRTRVAMVGMQPVAMTGVEQVQMGFALLHAMGLSPDDIS